jgi:hypothetical protein
LEGHEEIEGTEDVTCSPESRSAFSFGGLRSLEKREKKARIVFDLR